jgi:hypothetical protein
LAPNRELVRVTLDQEETRLVPMRLYHHRRRPIEPHDPRNPTG